MERLEADGYATGFTGKGWGPGIAKDIQGKDRRITGKGYQSKTAPPPAQGISNRDYASNFDDFLKQTPEGKPWAFWYGATEPHRGYEYGSGVRKGKKLSDIDRVPSFWPDDETIRNDMLDYAVEVEHFDMHLGRILAALERTGQLENTLIVATSDHGMPFPRCKGQAYDFSNHVPLAIRWPQGIQGAGRSVQDYVSFADMAPTFLEVAGVAEPGPIMQPMTGRSLTDIFRSARSGQVIADRDHVLVGKERHDIGRPNGAGYPIRGIFLNNVLYLRNYETDRWPAGNPETGYLNCDASPTKTALLDLRRSGANRFFWNLAFGKRAEEEMYLVTEDPDCVNNLADSASLERLKAHMKSRMEEQLKAEGDPRMFGKGEIFDQYPYSSEATDHFYERYMKGEKIRAGWVNPTDFEKEILD